MLAPGHNLVPLFAWGYPRVSLLVRGSGLPSANRGSWLPIVVWCLVLLEHDIGYRSRVDLIKDYISCLVCHAAPLPTATHGRGSWIL
eukprot:3193005-Rhodomonas_salina.1